MENLDKWLLAHHDPVAALRSFSSCMTLADLHGDGEVKLVIADMGASIGAPMKLKVFKGTNLISENTLLDCPTGMVSFHMDTTEPKVPAVAVASGSYIYIYKNLRPYFKFTLPTLEVNSVEFDAWNQARDDMLDIGMLYEILDSLRQDVGECGLTTRSQRFLMCQDKATQKQFLETHKGFILKRQTVLTCIDILKKNQEQEDDAVSCLVLGTESANIYILDPEAFVILTHVALPSVPVFLCVSGLFDVEYRIIVACRNGFIYTLKRNSKIGRPTVELSSQPVGLIKRGKLIIVGTMDGKLQCYNNKGKRLWNVDLPDSITCIESIDIRNLAQELVAVALKDCRVHIYLDKHLVDTIKTHEYVTAMKFGRYGREKHALILILKGGSLIVFLLRRTARFNVNTVEGQGSASGLKLNIPKKTKLFVDQTIRERENAVLMHRIFQHDLYRLRLNTARAYVHSLETSTNPVSSSVTEPVKLSAQVLGLGPNFRLKVELQNTSSTNTPSVHLIVVLHYDNHLYDVEESFIRVPMLVPGVNYTVDTLVKSLSESGIADVIRIYIVKEGNPKPLISAIINMPVAEVFSVT